MKQSIVFSLCNSEWCVRFIKKKGDITWFSTKVFGVGGLSALRRKRKKVFDLLGTTLESEQYQEIPISII